MSRTYKDNRKVRSGAGRRDRAISARGVRRSEPDLRRLSRAVIELALAEAEAAAQKKPNAEGQRSA